ncbi:DNA excision repair protein ERCC-1 [Brienomyrus brachyistius]|uniref:DNA excision repair protein ERCC-1 n=1 Tax=Brienomyrus brachyistius TaxID=42636 RepID=UPI0020B2710B|nr:DNA excision repair protein ERCC-1 [Brienomyrus brachyistius]
MDKKKFTINLGDSAFTTERPQAKSLFKASSRSDEPPGEAPGQAAQPPLSYAEFIIQRKGQAAQSSDAGAQGIGEQGASAKQSADSETADAGVGVHEPADAQGEAARSDLALGSGPKPAGTGSSIIVSPRQRGNPILKFVRSVPWEFGEVIPDYILGPTTCALFLSLRYHNLHPNYIHDRLKNLGQTFTLRVLLVQVDVKDPHHALKELARICIMADCTLILAWSPEEAGRYLETYKAYEKKPADLLKEQVEKDFLSKVTDCLTTVKSINRTDAITLLSTFSSLEGVMKASKEDLALCPGLGPQKARRLYDVLHQPFLKSKSRAET